jgi:flavin reductase (DIM6/NTAB) family NADH-FMN oxidoreductase RutF
MRSATVTIDPRELRNCLGHFATGVTVVTCYTDDGLQHGATVNAFTAVSLDPPLVLVSVNRTSRMSAFLEGRPFVVNVLHLAQRDLALHFAGGPCVDDVPWEGDLSRGAPRLRGCLASISCTPWRSYDGGDHVLFVGEVQEFHRTTGAPLLFHTGQFHGLHREPEPAPWEGSGDAPGAVAWIAEAASLLRRHLDDAPVGSGPTHQSPTRPTIKEGVNP